MPDNHPHRRAFVWNRCLGRVWALVCAAGVGVAAAEESANVAVTQYLSVDTELAAAGLGQLQNAALGLQRQAEADQSAALVIEIQAGPTDWTSALQWAEFLASAALRDVRTIAWVPQTLTGPRALLALCCRELVLHPDAELGDLSRHAPLTADVRQRLQRLAARQVNPRVSPAVVTSMLDPATTLVHVSVDAGTAAPTVRVVLSDELALLKAAGVTMQNVRTIKPAGALGLYSGAQAAAEGFLATHVAHDRAELAAACGLHLDPVAGRPAAVAVTNPVLVKVEGEITSLLTAYLQRQIDRAVERSADLIIFEIDSPGGLLQDSLELAYRIADLREQGIRTVAYVPRDAVSGAALISLGCDEIYLHPSGKIGDAGPIELSADGNVHRAPEKIVSYLREVVRELAELKQRPPAVAMAMVDRELDVHAVTHRDNGRTWYLTPAEIAASKGEWIAGPLVPEAAGELLLFINGRRAHDLRIAEAPVNDLAELRQRLGVPAGAKLAAIERIWLDDLVFILNTPFVTGALFFLGIILLFIELHFMLGVAGILSAMCFGVFFWSKFLGGTAGWLEVLLFLLGFACIAIEVFVIPGFGVFGLAGGLLVLGSLVMAGTALNTLDRGVAVDQTLATAWTLGLAIAAVVGASLLLSQFLPHIPLLNAMILAPPAPAELSSLATGSRRGVASPLIGQQGRTTTMLRPSGKVRLGGQLVDAVSATGFIAPDEAVEVVEVASNRLVVRRLTASPTTVEGDAAASSPVV